MKVTNKHNLPEAIFNFLARDRYTPGENDISVTTLIGPPQKARIMKEHFDEMEEDAMDKVWSLLGHGVHNLLEDHTETGEAEERLYYESPQGLVVGGQIDNQEGGIIRDYKVTSTYKIQKGDYEDWENQLNCYAFLCACNGKTVRQLQIVTILRDWRESNLLRDRDYPKTPVLILDIPLWSYEQQEAYIEDQIAQHREKVPRPCTDREMWAEPDKWAVQKIGAGRATKVFNCEEDADFFLKEKGDKYEIVFRPGKRKCCERYCPAAQFCKQWKEFNNDNNE